MEQLTLQKNWQEELEQDLDEIRYESGKIGKERRRITESLDSVLEQLKLTDYEAVKERLDHCVMRLQQIPKERESSAAARSRLQTELKQLGEMLEQTEKKKNDILIRRDWQKQTLKRNTGWDMWIVIFRKMKKRKIWRVYRKKNL